MQARPLASGCYWPMPQEKDVYVGVFLNTKKDGSAISCRAPWTAIVACRHRSRHWPAYPMGFRLRPPSRIGGHASLHGETKLKIRNLKENTFHREVLDTAPSALFQKIAYKVSETGGKYVTAPTKELKPSQTCICGQQKKKARSERWHRCGACGFEAGRDETAALIVLYWSFGILPPLKKEKKNKNGQEPGESPNRRNTILSDSVLKPRNHHPSSSEFGGV